MKLIVAEKPSVARDIARVLGAKDRKEGYLEGNGYRVTWALGHLITLCDPEEIKPEWKRWRAADLPMLPEELPLKIVAKTKPQYNIIKKLLRDKETETVICATDAGREGELIFRYIIRMANAPANKEYQRLWISSMTDEAIRRGFSTLKPLRDYDTLYQSARCRSEADWLVGMNGSRAFTLRYDVLLSVGRVQTPTLAILTRRRKEIEEFKPEKYFEVEADFGEYKGIWIDADGKSRIAEQEKAKAIASAVKGKPARVDVSRRERKKTPPPLLYDLTALQRDANKRYGMTAEQTLKAAQALYEKHKAITYPRTDSNHLPNDMQKGASDVIKNMQEPYREIAALIPSPQPVPGRVYNDAKVTDHHAIIPTTRKPSGMTSTESDVYDLVVRGFLAAFLPDYQYDSLRVETVCEGERFLSQGQVPVIKGWKAAWEGREPAVPAKGKKDEGKEQNLPDLSVGEALTTRSAKALNKSTKPPSPHTEASLLAAMERAGRDLEDEAARELMRDSGLGTPATRAAIIERLIKVGYAARKGRALHATDKGMKLIGIVPDELSSPETTGRWEKGLAGIRAGKMEPERFMESIRRFTAFITDRASKSETASPFEPEERKSGKRKSLRTIAGVKCPLCGGAVTETDKAFGCAEWRSKGCKFTMWKNMASAKNGPAFTKSDAKALIQTGRLEKDAGVFSLSNGRAYYTAKNNAPPKN